MKPNSLSENKAIRIEGSQDSSFQNQQMTQINQNSGFIQNYYNGNNGSKVR